ncbi:MAG: putative sulfate exporter family transporter [Azospirillaceae bacterium]
MPGLALCLIIAAAARYLSDYYGAPQMLFALLIGIAFHFVIEEERFARGVDFAARKVLRFGVTLLGLRITFGEIASLGWEVALLLIGGVALTILFGIGGASLLGRRAQFGALTGGAVAICGASAALAISAVLPRHDDSERNLIFTVIAVTTFSTIAMIVFPVIAGALGFDERTTGLFLGGTIHDVAQVVGAGYSVSPDAGDVATIAKLFRVAMLVPAVIVIALAFRAPGSGTAGGVRFPLFLIGFCACVVINSLGVLPEAVRSGLEDLSGWCLVAAVAALGIKTSLKTLFTIGYQPVLMVLAETLFIAVWVAVGVSHFS